MRTSYPTARRSLGAGLASIGTVLLLVAGLLVAFEAPMATATGGGGPDPGCVRIEGADVGVDQTVVTNGVAVLIDNWVLNPGESGEWIGFSWTVTSGEAEGIVKGGSMHSSNGYSEWWGPAVSGSWSVTPPKDAAISHIDVCGIPPSPFEASATGDCDGWHVTFNQGNEWAEMWVLSPVPWSPGWAVYYEPGTYFIPDPTPGGPLDATFTVKWLTSGYVQLHHETFSATRADCTPPTLTLVKTWEGEPWEGFEMQVVPVAGGPPVSMDSGVPRVFDRGTFEASELGMPAEGYEAGSWGGDCATDGTVTLDHGDAKVCTITNTELPDPVITVTKIVDGGTAVAGDFTLLIDQIQKTFGITYAYPPGIHTIAETGGPSGYAAAIGGDCAADGSIDMGYGGVYECVITNSYVPPTITVIKTVVNLYGSVGPDDFTLKVGDTEVESGVPTDFAPGPYTVSESGGPSGYTAGPWGGDCAADGSIVLGDGEDLVCTITNTEQPASLTIVKDAIPADDTVFSFQGDVETDGSMTTWWLSDPSRTSITFPQVGVWGRPLTVTETGSGPGDWFVSSITCSNGSSVDVAAATAYVSVGPGEDVTCTFTNRLPDPTLTLVKIWGGDGIPWPGFGMEVTPVGDGVPVAMASGVSESFAPGIYRAGEFGDPGVGYDAGTWGGDCAADGTVSLAYGEDKVCTITNTDLPEPTLTILKTWVDDVEPYAGFGFYATPAGGGDIAFGDGVPKIVEPGTYTVWETDPPSGAWLASQWGGDCAADGSITLDYEDHEVCTISNELRPPPELTLVKTWEGEPFDGFELQVTGGERTGTWSMESGVARTFDPGEYTAEELGMPAEGYQTDGWGGDCESDGDVVLGWGDSKTCTITNYETPTIVLTKIVIGGDAAPDDFELRVVPADGAEPFTMAMLSGVEREIAPGGYQAMETLLENYLADPWGGDCDEDGFFEIGWGDHLECTITNTDPLPKLTVTKIVLGGEAEPDDFDLTVTPVGGAPIPVLSAERNDFDPGDYVAGESNLDGYAPGEWGGDCDTDGSVTLRPVTADVADDLACTITNVATTTTSVVATTSTSGTTPVTEGETTTTTAGVTTTIPDLPRTGGGGIGGVGYLPMLLGGLGLALLGAGLVLLAPRRQHLQVV